MKNDQSFAVLVLGLLGEALFLVGALAGCLLFLTALRFAVN